EEIIAGIFHEVLKPEKVGREDDFFDLGGHSLLAMQAVSRVRKTFGVEIGLALLFERPTVRGLAGAVEEVQREKQGLTVPALAPRDRGKRLPLSSGQQRLWFMDQLNPGGNFYNVNRAIRLRGRLDTGALERALKVLVERHEALR